MGLKGLTINTDRGAQAHYLAEDDASIFRALLGGQDAVYFEGSTLATKLEQNKVRIGACVLFVGGHAGRIAGGDSATLTLPMGVAGQNRVDLICAVFKRNRGVDAMELIVKQGTSTSGVAVEPATTSGNLDTGATLREFKLLRIEWNGSTMGTPALVAPRLQVGLLTVGDGTNYATRAQGAKADGALPRTGGTMSGDITMSGRRVKGLGTPQASTDSATKGYADSVAQSAASAVEGKTQSKVRYGTSATPPSDLKDGDIYLQIEG